MIELNLLKEGHGILYKEKKTPLYVKFIRVSVLLFVFTGAVFFIIREELYTTWYIVSDDEGGIDLENFFKSEQDEDMEIQEIIKRPVEEAVTPIEKQPAVEVAEVVEEKKADLIEEKAVEEKKIEEPPVKEEQATAPAVQEEIVSEVKDKARLELSYRVVAGACLLRESADNIIDNLKKHGYENAYIKTATMPIDMYFLYLGEFKTTEEIDFIKEKNKSVAFHIENKNGGYLLNTESVNSTKEAERLKRLFGKSGIKAEILKRKERKDVFVVVVKNFDDYKEADIFNKELRDKGFPAVVASQ